MKKENKPELSYSGVVQWDAEYQVLTDQMGIMIPLSDVSLLRELCELHATSHTKLEREAIGRRTVERLGENTAIQFNFDYFSE